MAGLSDLLNLSGHGLQTYQSQIQIHSQNISNVNTEGYSRRFLEQGTMAGSDGLGNGVQTGDVMRAFNAMGMSQLLREDCTAQYHETLASELSTLEMLSSGDGTGGLYSSLQDFELALQDVTASPEDLAARTVLLQKGASLAQQFNTLATRFDEFAQGMATDTVPVDGESAVMVSDLNSMTSRMQELNKQIYRAEVSGKSAPELLDERDGLVRELSQGVNVTVGTDYRVTLGGQELVSADGQTLQTLDQTGATTFEVGGVDVSTSITEGSMAGMMSARTASLSMRSQLDTLASALATELNAVFDSSYNLSGETPASQGYTFFTGTSADTLALDTTLYDPTDPMAARPDLFAAAATRASAGPPAIPNTGDNSAAQAMVDIMNNSSTALSGASMSEYWLQVETALTSYTQEETQLAESSGKVVDMLDMGMQEVAGVNLDEELMLLMGSQRAYEASAKLMSTANSLLETLMNIR